MTDVPGALRFRFSIALIVLTVLITSAGLGVRADEPLKNPLLGEPEAIAAGERLYNARCVICHARAGGRGPNLFATRLNDEQFLNVAINGRKDTMMPALRRVLSTEEIWQIHSFVKANKSAF